MADKKAQRPAVLGWRPNEDDWVLIDQLEKKLGIRPSHLVRIGLRKLAEAEGLKLKKAS